MKVNIEELIEEAIHYMDELGKNWYDDLLEKYLNENKDAFAIIEPSTLLNPFHRINGNVLKLKECYITGIYELGCIAPNVFHHTARFKLLLFSKRKPNKVKICDVPKIKIEIKGVEVERDKSDLGDYYKDLEYFINDSKISESIKLLVNEVPFNAFYEELCDVRFYSKKYLAMAKSAKKQKTKPLKDLVDILWSNHDIFDTRMAKTITPPFYSYPLRIDELQEKPIGSMLLQKGDIVVNGYPDRHFKIYLIADELNQEVMPNVLSRVLRVKSNLVTPEYLFLYMHSNMFRVLSSPLDSSVFVKISLLGDIPVLLPNTDTPLALNKELSQKYRDIFDRTYRPYLFKDKQDYFSDSQRPVKTVVKEDALLDELLETYFKEPHKKNLLNYINVNMKELNVSIPNGAYRSAVVLIGSILEAFLTDWASELDRKNYFEKPYREALVNGRKVPIDLSLNDAICHIAKIIKKWNAREMADAIRVMRNDIHPRVFLDNGKNLTKRECEKAVKNLEAVIRSRYDDYSSSSFKTKMN